MEAHVKLTDDTFEQQFHKGKLDPSVFSHEAHLRLAWLYIMKYGVEATIAKICTEIKNFALQNGAPHKFNRTVTVAAVKAVHHFVLKSEAKSFSDFIREFPRLKYRFKDLMRTHYSFDIYSDPKAKEHFLPPDILPFE
ncbi:MAG: hypothetical protein AAF717_05115 [Bacteroidota bacterium]